MKISKKERIIKKITACFLAGLLVICGLAGCQKKEEEAVPDTIKVDTVSAEYGTLKITTDYIATLSPNLTVDVVPLVAGIVKKIKVKVGDRVKAGDLLCQLDDTSADLSVKSARDAVNSAKAGKNAAKTQTDSAKIQADANVRTLKKTLKTYEKSLGAAQKQLNKLQASKNNIRKSQAAAQKTYTDAKKRYKAAQRLQIQYDTFLTDNPDCRTTAGLTAAATMVPGISPVDGSGGTGGQIQTDPSGQASGGDGQDTGNPIAGDSSQSSSGSQPSATTDTASQEAALKKQKQAQALLTALTEAGLTVEYLSAAGIKALGEDVTDCETAYTGTSSGLSQIDASISTLKSNISQLKTQIDTTKDSLNSARKLANAVSSGTEAYDAQIEAARTGVEAAQYQKDLYRLTSPINGIVDAVNVKKEGMAAQGYAAFTISEKSSMIATFYVTEDVRNFLVIGDTVSLLKDDGEKAEDLGHITSIGTAVDPQKGLFKVEAEFVTTGQKKLSSGSSIRLSIVSNAVSGELIIPYDCVYYDDGQAYVYKVIDGKAVRTDVETGLFNEDHIIVISGLQAGDHVITTWASGLKDGAEVVEMNGIDPDQTGTDGGTDIDGTEADQTDMPDDTDINGEGGL